MPARRQRGIQPKEQRAVRVPVSHHLRAIVQLKPPCAVRVPPVIHHFRNSTSAQHCTSWLIHMETATAVCIDVGDVCSSCLCPCSVFPTAHWRGDHALHEFMHDLEAGRMVKSRLVYYVLTIALSFVIAIHRRSYCFDLGCKFSLRVLLGSGFPAWRAPAYRGIYV